MAENNHNEVDQLTGEAEEGQATPASEDFYSAEVERYASVVDNDLNQALDRYGFTLYHSLPPTKQVEVSQQIGLARGDAVDLFNLAGVAIEREDYAGAIDLLQKALKQDKELADAEYNLALCYEKQDNKAQAVKHWNRFLELAEEEEDKQLVEQHLQELNA